MEKKTGASNVLRCSFCNKMQSEVRKLVAGPAVFICNECVEVCATVMLDDAKADGTVPDAVIPP